MKTKQSKISYNYRCTPQGYQGYISVYSGATYLYSLYSKIYRVDGLDAHYDAKIMQQDLLEENGMKKETI